MKVIMQAGQDETGEHKPPRKRGRVCRGAKVGEVKGKARRESKRSWTMGSQSIKRPPCL